MALISSKPQTASKPASAAKKLVVRRASKSVAPVHGVVMKKAASTPVTRGRQSGDYVIGAFKTAIDAHGNRLKQLTDDANAQADEADRKASAGNVRVVA